MAIEVTGKAAKQILALMKKNNMAEGGLRVSIKAGGCSGFLYIMDLDSQQRPDDKIFESGDARVFCDPKSFAHLDNMILDYNDSLMWQGFVFNNPNATRTCGCGQSFS
jgi:iron-sulfur cluster assembly protein